MRRRPSEAPGPMMMRCSMPSRSIQKFVTCTVLLLAVTSIPHTVFAQSAKWSITGSMQYGLLRLNAVDEKNQSDADGWRQLFFPVGQFASVKNPLMYSAGLSYRVDRDWGVSLTGTYWLKTVSASSSGPDEHLQLDRSVGETDIVFAFALYPAARPFFLEWYGKLNIGMIFARATSRAVGANTQIIGGVPTLVPYVDTDESAKKSGLIGGAGLGADVPLFPHFSLTAEASYRYAMLGQLNSDVTSFGVTTSQQTSIDFDYSGFLLSAGVRFEF